MPQVKIVQVIHVLDSQSVEDAKDVSVYVDALLLDSGNPNLAVKELGGTGRVHDWALSAQIRQQVDKPVFLAGGLRATNVADAISTVGPFGLDLCSSVRRDGRLCTEDLAEFINPPSRQDPLAGAQAKQTPRVIPVKEKTTQH